MVGLRFNPNSLTVFIRHRWLLLFQLLRCYCLLCLWYFVALSWLYTKTEWKLVAANAMYTRNGKKKSWSVCYCCTMCVECRKDTQRPSRVGELENDGGNNVQQQYHINERLSLLTVLQTYGAINNNTAIARVKAMKKMSGKMAEENQKKKRRRIFAPNNFVFVSRWLCAFRLLAIRHRKMKWKRVEEMSDFWSMSMSTSQFRNNSLAIVCRQHSLFAFRWLHHKYLLNKMVSVSVAKLTTSQFSIRSVYAAR